MRVLTLDINFYVPFTREVLLAMGICSVSRKSCNENLNRGPGSAILIAVGGAEESLHSKPGTYRLTLGKGFVSIALNQGKHSFYVVAPVCSQAYVFIGANLVPVLGFGETDIYDAYVYPEDSWVRKAQEAFKKVFMFSVPIFKGRGLFNYSFGVMPYRKPIFTVVGKPVKVPRAPPHLRGDNLYKTEEGRQLVEMYRDKYIDALTELYNEFKDNWAVDRAESMQISQR